MLTHTIEIDEKDVETYITGYHIINELPSDFILQEAWVHTTDGEEINCNGIVVDAEIARKEAK